MKKVMMAAAAVVICALACWLALQYDGTIRFFLIAVVSGTAGGVIGAVTQYFREKKLAKKREEALRKQALENMEELKKFFFGQQGAEFLMWREDMKKYALYSALDLAIREEWWQELKNPQSKE